MDAKLKQLLNRNCESSYQFIMSWNLVHGVCTSPTGEAYISAWAEREDEVFNPSDGRVISKCSFYYLNGIIDYKVNPDAKEAGLSETLKVSYNCQEMLTAYNGTFGPWDNGILEYDLTKLNTAQINAFWKKLLEKSRQVARSYYF